MKIGIFDSGLGGLVITKAFIKTLPEYDYVYYGDTTNLPYGDKTSGQILAYTIEAMKFLIRQECKLIIIACNTATAITLRYLQQRFVPEYSPQTKILGVVIPTVEEACENGFHKTGIIATQATVRSHIYQTELLKLSPDMQVQELAAPKLVPAIENNDFTQAALLAKDYAQQFDGIDSLVLGCTHYPLLKENFRTLLPGVKVVSQDELMGEKLKNYLKRHPEIDHFLSKKGERRFMVSNLTPQYQEIAERLFEKIIIVQAS